MDIKAKIEELVEKLKGDEKLLKKFAESPVKTVEGLIGVDLPDDKLKDIVDGIKAKLKIDELGGKLGGIENKLGGLFGKK